MNTTVEALKNAYVALGGELTDTYEDIAGGIPVSDYVVIPDVINTISKKLSTVIESISEAELPSVTTDDNGKVLKVVDGAWELGTDLTE